MRFGAGWLGRRELTDSLVRGLVFPRFLEKTEKSLTGLVRDFSKAHVPN